MVHQGIIQSHIDYFLNCVANWTPRWFNKPKFHIILHLVEHIRRFGPSLLFATETFESYNVLIRSLSVHSNWQAPSRDIAIGFANISRIRHLSSGGKFFVSSDKGCECKKAKPGPTDSITANLWQEKASIPTHHDFISVGKKVSELIDQQNQVFRSAFGGPQPGSEGMKGST